MKRHFIFLLLCSMTATISAQTFGGGSGTQSDPYKISTPAHLKELAEWVNQNPVTDKTKLQVENFISYGKYFIQTGPIDMAEVTDFEPIGNNIILNPSYSICAFAGHYDGQNYPIKNLKINTSTQYSGLFGVAIGAEFKRIRMVSYQYTIKAKQKNSIYYGSILGYMNTQGASGYDESDILKWKVRITDCECSGTIIVPADSINRARCGGIATDGYMDIRNCKSFLKMQCENLGSYKYGLEVGGIAYILRPSVVTDSTVIENCLSRLDFVCNGNKPPMQIFGIGSSQNSIRNCFSSGKIYAGTVVGIGNAWNISCCGSDAELHGAGAHGISYGGRVVSDCYFTGSIYDYANVGLSSKAPISSEISRVENCYSAPSKLDATVKSSLIDQIAESTPIEPYPIRHCFISSNVSAKDSAYVERPYNDTTKYRLDMYRMDDEAMKTPAFADTLNSYSGKKLWKQDAACNFGYPILAASPMPASAYTKAADSITGSSARLHASFIYGDEAANVLERGIAWKMREDKEWSKDTNLIKDNTLKLNGLQAKPVYMFRAYIERSVGGTLYGESLTFVTKQSDALNEAAADEQITVSPNPATDQLQLRDAQGSLPSLRVFNAVGQEVLRQELSGSTGTVNISTLSKGIYFLQIRTGHGTVMRKIAKN
ncbi:MAG: T9SS type A sorting domain-containing protein [Bacteroidales bacterium]|nr:T9SS type A sorting domain-containing protein [Bacteroidales bacterium]